MNEFEPLLKKEEEKLNLNSIDSEKFEEPALKQDKENNLKIEYNDPIDATDFETPILKKDMVIENEKKPIIESPIDATDFEEPALKIEQDNDSNQIDSSAENIGKFEEPVLKEENVTMEDSVQESKNVTLEELKNNQKENILTETKKIDNKSLLATYILGAITLFFVIITARSFYCGFKYYDVAHHPVPTPNVQTNQ